MVKLFDLGEADVHLRFVQRLARVQQLGQAVQGLGPKHHVHIGRALDDLGAFLAGHAATHANLHAFGLEVLDAPQIAKHLLLCLLAYRAGVEQNQICLVHVVGFLIALGGVQHVRHLVRVVLVHLAAEGFDKDFFGHGGLLGATLLVAACAMNTGANGLFGYESAICPSGSVAWLFDEGQAARG